MTDTTINNAIEKSNKKNGFEVVVKTTNEQDEILSKLANFTGTDGYHKLSLGNIIATDGIKYMTTELKCFWLIDIISSVQHLDKISSNDFIVWKIRVNLDKSFIVRAYSDYSQEGEEKNKQYLLYEQKGAYSDFKLNEFEFYQNGNILLLKSEY